MSTLHQIANRLKERAAEMTAANAIDLAKLLQEGDRMRGQLDILREALRQDLSRIDQQSRMKEALSEPAATAAIIDCAG